MNFIDEAVAGFVRIDCNVEESSTVSKMLSDSIAALLATEKLLVKTKVSQYNKLHCRLFLRNCHSPPSLQQLPH